MLQVAEASTRSAPVLQGFGVFSAASTIKKGGKQQKSMAWSMASMGTIYSKLWIYQIIGISANKFPRKKSIFITGWWF
jgi:hypothetical protein